MTMTIIPAYYRDFQCLADRCRHNCCIGWEIDIDPDTMVLYNTIDGAFGKRLRDGIVQGDTPCFLLDDRERCVFLNERGLCDIMLTLGEDALCDICTDHPRFRTYLSDTLHLGVGLCCEAACRLILTTPVRFQNADTGETVPLDVDTAPYTSRHTPADWARVYRSLERMDDKWDGYLDALERAPAFTARRDDTWERLTAYFRFRHVHKPFAAHAAAVILTIADASNADFEGLCEICRLYSAEIEYSDENTDILKQKTAED